MRLGEKLGNPEPHYYYLSKVWYPLTTSSKTLVVVKFIYVKDFFSHKSVNDKQ